MNYRHAFHAGNFADVVKHALVCLIVDYLKRKEKPFRVLDSHAGRGFYDLASDEARRTGEYREGIARFLAAPESADPVFAPYREALGPEALADPPLAYPGSPLLVRRLLRRQDRLSAYELHPVDAESLAALFAGDVQVKAIELDGWLALGAHLPPKEKRGLVLVDPPFEKPGEFDRIAAHLAKAQARWAGGIYALWYPIKRLAERDAFLAALAGSGVPDIVAAEFLREAPGPDERFVGTGLAVVNPPFTFEADATRALRLFEGIFGNTGRATSRIERVSPERG
ncbi:23S rRNA (adenine(2030)-N(6))-methyltransferase RlmJ [Antarcticirhabdus aurantiaca]|uniref:23S rRNA (Adenine(2030)-N(6))-methyltransferase RlmJ n=1 Tax=Antarcticirhabdus aurantiaca TaxID=2606717 RepID=A0ACD4NUF9_9HYPH|nr:23S rRNA (adenine(2030)-N(6))-methyltransferase RlmJ [Antarcticirhabdus aurantiaca]WAJ30464.1 23S rRNA (adenine(2030)-N(6))-methyltransferase RlmJ [Jeongeuplla avenae]